MAKQTKSTKPSKIKGTTEFFSAWLDTEVMRDVRAKAEANDRSIAREVNHRLKQTVTPGRC